MNNPGGMLEKALYPAIGKTRKILTRMLKSRSGAAGRLVLPVAVFLPPALLAAAAFLLLSSSHLTVAENPGGDSDGDSDGDSTRVMTEIPPFENHGKGLRRNGAATFALEDRSLLELCFSKAEPEK